MNKEVLFLLGDCPGYYVALMYSLAERLASVGVKIVVASTSPYYEKYNDVDFNSLGQTYYLSDYLKQNHEQQEIDTISIDYWNVYPTYVRDNFYFGRHKNKWDEYKKTALYFKEIFTKHSIDLVISEPPSNSFIYLGFSEAKKRQKLFFGIMSARIPKHVNIFMDEYGESLLENPFYSDEPKTEISGPPDYMLTHEHRVIRDKWYVQVLRMFRYAHLKSIETGRTSTHQLRSIYKKNIWRKLRYLRVKSANVFSNDFDSNDRINIFFPLHYRPEASTSVLSRYYEDDLELLKNIAFSLPNNVQLIVKEHSAATGMRNVPFYRKLLSFPNTVLLSPDFDFLGQISRFDAVVVLTSTVGFEAIQAGIPVFLLGRTFYSSYPGVVSVDSIAQLEHFLRNLTKENHAPNTGIMRVYRKHCFEGRFDYMSSAVLDDNNIDKLMVPISRAIRSKNEKD